MCFERGTTVILGVVALGGTVLGYVAAPVFLLLPALVGIHLIQFPFTGFCPLNAYMKKQSSHECCCGGHDKKDDCCHGQ